MKRSECGVKGREEGEVKRSRFQAEESSESAPEFNPFLVEPILVRLLKLVESVSQLKELRKMCQIWDEFNLQELEERAFKGKLKAIDICLTNNFRTLKEPEDNLVQFMGDTSAIPRLFTSFKVNFPESWVILSKHMEFFSIYPVTFVHLAIPNYLDQEQIRLLLAKFMETELWGNLKEINVSTIVRHKEKHGLPDPSLFVPASGSIQMKLQKLDINVSETTPIFSVFESSFASGKYINLTSLGLDKLEDGNLNFPGLDLSKLTRLDIGQVVSSIPALNFTSDLIKLAGNGIMLKDFNMILDVTLYKHYFDDLSIFVDNLPLICSNLTQFLSSQSSTLERMIFRFVCHLKKPIDLPEGADIRCKIHLPKFKVLHTLNLCVDFKLIEANATKTHTQLFEMSHSIAVHFPKLINLTLQGEWSLAALKVNSTPDEAGQLHLKRLEIFDWGNKNVWTTSFMGVIGSVGELKWTACSAAILHEEVIPLSWGASLRQLNLNEMNLRIKQLKFFNPNHFKKLERIFIKYERVRERGVHIRTRNGTRPLGKGDYLNAFKEIAQLPLTSITFQGPQMEEEFREGFIQYFPFPVEFKIDTSNIMDF